MDSLPKILAVLMHDRGDEVRSHLISILGLLPDASEAIQDELIQDELRIFKQIEAHCSDIWSNIGNEDIISSNLQELAELFRSVFEPMVSAYLRRDSKSVRDLKLFKSLPAFLMLFVFWSNALATLTSRSWCQLWTPRMPCFCTARTWSIPSLWTGMASRL